LLIAPPRGRSIPRLQAIGDRRDSQWRRLIAARGNILRVGVQAKQRHSQKTEAAGDTSRVWGQSMLLSIRGETVPDLVATIHRSRDMTSSSAVLCSGAEFERHPKNLTVVHLERTQGGLSRNPSPGLVLLLIARLLHFMKCHSMSHESSQPGASLFVMRNCYEIIRRFCGYRRFASGVKAVRRVAFFCFLRGSGTQSFTSS
jgi:hypothetical protein